MSRGSAWLGLRVKESSCRASNNQGHACVCTASLRKLRAPGRGWAVLAGDVGFVFSHDSAGQRYSAGGPGFGASRQTAILYSGGGAGLYGRELSAVLGVPKRRGRGPEEKHAP